MVTLAAEVIRDELLSVERLEERAAPSPGTAWTRRPTLMPTLLARVRENARVLLRCYRALAAVIEDERAVTPAAEWLVDNFHIVDDTLAEVRDRLAGGVLPEAPRPRSGAATGHSSRLRPGPDVRGPHRQPLRAGDIAPLSAGLPAGPAPADRRAVGRAHRAAHPPGGESATPVRADRRRPRRPPPGGPARRHAPGARPGPGRSPRRFRAPATTSRRRSSFSSPGASATRIPGPPPPSAGSRSGSPRPAPRPKRWRSRSTSGRPPPT